MIPLFVLLACASPDYGLSPDPADALAPPALLQGDAQADDAPSAPQSSDEPAVATAAGGSATAAWVVGEGRRDQFELGPDAASPLVDFLFVVDPSSSMRKVLEPFQAGFAELAARGAFPERSRIGVMTTTPAALDNPRRAHPAVHNRATARRIPGFVSLVSKSSIERYRGWAREDRAARFTQPGCGPWFQPSQRNTEGTPCLVAHTQPALVTVWVEDGLLAFSQLLDKVGPDALFRTGTAANVVIVSDTYGPGFVPEDEDFQAWHWFDALQEARPDHDALAARLAVGKDLASFRVHAVVPLGDCGEKRVVDGLDSAELAAARASGGVVADICAQDDYTPVVEQILATGAQVQQPVVALSRPADQVGQVRVDGQPVSFRLSADGRAVVLQQQPGADAQVQVDYRPRAHRRR